MKVLNTFTQDGFKASIELLKFIREMNADLLQAIVSIIGTSAVFVKGGAVSEAGGNTTVTSGILLKDAKLYTFTGGTMAGTPATVKILMEEATASGYPQPFFVNDPLPKDVYLARTARLDAAGSITVASVGTIHDLQFLRDKADLVDGKADKNGYTDISASVTVNPAFSVVRKAIRQYQDGTVTVSFAASYTGSKVLGQVILTSLPKAIDYGYYQCQVFTGSTLRQNIDLILQSTYSDIDAGIGGLAGAVGSNLINFYLEYKKA